MNRPEASRELAARLSGSVLFCFLSQTVHADEPVLVAPRSINRRNHDLYIVVSGDSPYRSTVAFLAMPGVSFVRSGKKTWAVRQGEQKAVWDASTGRFTGGEAMIESAHGFDTFWYIWSLTRPQSELLRKSR